MTDTSSAVSPAALYRLSGDAAAQSEASNTALALTPYEYGHQTITPQTNPTTQDQHPSAQRLAASQQWAGKTGQVNRAQAAQDQADIWVTVPVDKIETKGGSTAAAPVYATPQGYRARPGESAGSIPPPHRVGHPY
jgi:hypothetical protein